MNSSQSINKLFVLASVQENIILAMQDNEFKQMAKFKFNRAIKEIKSLNKFVNGVLDDNDINGFDEVTEKIMEVLNDT